jgi:ribonuclease D
VTEIYAKKYNIPCPSLSEVCKIMFKEELCKGEQISNWERRPLRLRQLHYAALDAFILLKIYDNLI